MQTFTSKFSLKDFIAYLFPGLTWMLAILVMLAVSADCDFSRAFRHLFFTTIPPGPAL